MSAAFVGLQVELVHVIPGRVRLRVPALKWDVSLAERVAAAGMGHSGVTRVRVNRASASVVIEGEPVHAAGAAALTLVRAWLESPPEQGVGAPERPGSGWGRVSATALPLAGLALSWVNPLAGAAVTLLGAIPIARRAIDALVRERRPSVDQLDASAVALMLMLGEVPAAALMCGLVALGEEIRERTARSSRRATMDLQDALGRSAWRLVGTEKEQVPVDQLRRGDVVAVYTGDLIPVDGVVIDGSAMVDQKTLTGESRLVPRNVRDGVLAATVVADGKIYVRAEAVGSATRAGLVVRALEGAAVYDTRVSSWANRFADRLVGPTFALAGITFAVTGDVARAASILILDFATGIRVSAPTAVLATMTRAARDGVLIKGGRAIEKLAAVDAVVFDKTGTLTKGNPRVCEVVCLHEDHGVDSVLGLAAASELRLRHPSARAVVRHAKRCRVAVPRRESSSYTAGQGVHALVEGHSVRVGSARFMGGAGVDLTSAEWQVARLTAAGHSFVYVAIDGDLAGLIAYDDPPRPQASRLIAWLKDHGVSEILMVTGDEPAAAGPIARSLGIGRLHAATLPDEKAKIVADLQARGHVVAVIGDGINDSPALALADVSISLQNGADVARETADVVLMHPKRLMSLAQAIELSRCCMKLIRDNVAIVAAPNAAALVLATAGWLNPVGATLLNNGSTIVAGVRSLQPLLSDTRSSGKAGKANGRVKPSPPVSSELAVPA